MTVFKDLGYLSDSRKIKVLAVAVTNPPTGDHQSPKFLPAVLPFPQAIGKEANNKKVYYIG